METTEQEENSRRINDIVGGVYLFETNWNNFYINAIDATQL